MHGEKKGINPSKPTLLQLKVDDGILPSPRDLQAWPLGRIGFSTFSKEGPSHKLQDCVLPGDHLIHLSERYPHKTSKTIRRLTVLRDEGDEGGRIQWTFLLEAHSPIPLQSTSQDTLPGTNMNAQNC